MIKNGAISIFITMNVNLYSLSVSKGKEPGRKLYVQEVLSFFLVTIAVYKKVKTFWTYSMIKTSFI